MKPNILLMLPNLIFALDYGGESSFPDGKGKHKQQVYITKADGYECSGIMITESVALTAGHCVSPRFYDSDIKVSQPEQKCQQMGLMPQISEVIEACKIIEQFSEDFERNRDPTTMDIALVRLARPMQGMTAMKLADSAPKIGSILTLYGTGLNTVGSPCESFISIQTPILCLEYPQWICLKGVNGFGTACSGDSGGPIVSEQDEIVGIVSAGDLAVNFAQGEGLCGIGTTIASNVAFHKTWIEQQLESELGQCQAPSNVNQIYGF